MQGQFSPTHPQNVALIIYLMWKSSFHASISTWCINFQYTKSLWTQSPEVSLGLKSLLKHLFLIEMFCTYLLSFDFRDVWYSLPPFYLWYCLCSMLHSLLPRSAFPNIFLIIVDIVVVRVERIFNVHFVIQTMCTVSLLTVWLLYLWFFILLLY